MVPVNGFEGLYSVNFFGAVYSHRAGRYLKAERMKDGYLRYTMVDSGDKIRKSAHIIVMESFYGREAGKEVNHKDHVRDNNWIGNLEWVTKQRNIEHGKSRSFIITRPDGEVLEIFNLSKFCRENNLHLGAMHEMATGRIRKCRNTPRNHHKGFLCKYNENYIHAGEW